MNRYCCSKLKEVVEVDENLKFNKNGKLSMFWKLYEHEFNNGIYGEPFNFCPFCGVKL